MQLIMLNWKLKTILSRFRVVYIETDQSLMPKEVSFKIKNTEPNLYNMKLMERHYEIDRENWLSNFRYQSVNQDRLDSIIETDEKSALKGLTICVFILEIIALYRGNGFLMPSEDIPPLPQYRVLFLSCYNKIGFAFPLITFRTKWWTD